MPAALDPGPRRGAYGLAVAGLESQRELLVPAPAAWPGISVGIDPPAAVDPTLLLTERLARYPDGAGGHAAIDRGDGRLRFGGPRPLGLDEVVHPRLGMAAAVYAHWLGRAAFHAGAFVEHGRAWAVIGERGDGKSTLLAALALAGRPVIGDDTLVLDGAGCLAGVRCIDLRPGTAARLGCREDVVAVRRGARERLRLGPVAPAGPALGGWLLLAWGERLELRPLAAAERLARLARPGGWHRRGAPDTSLLLELAALPAWELRRRRDWAELPAVLERLRELTLDGRPAGSTHACASTTVSPDGLARSRDA